MSWKEELIGAWMRYRLFNMNDIKISGTFMSEELSSILIADMGTTLSRDQPHHSSPQKVAPRSLPPSPPRWRTLEFYFYYFVIIAFYIVMFRSALKIGSDKNPNYYYISRRLSKGWILGYQVDDSDAQLRSFRSQAGVLPLVMLGHVFLSQLVRKIAERIGCGTYNIRKAGFRSLFFSPRLLFSFVFSMVFLFVLHGYGALKLIILVSINYQIGKLSRRSRVHPLLTWCFNVTTLLFAYKIRATPFSEVSPIFSFLDGFDGILPRWHIHYNITVLRAISFNLDYYWSDTESEPISLVDQSLTLTTPVPNKQRVLQSWPSSVYSYPNYLAYLFYPPLYLAGPIITFNDFMHQMIYGNPGITRMGTLIYFGRLICCGLLTEFMLHTMYVQAAAKVGGFHDYSVTDLHTIGYLNLKFVWLKLLIIWRFFRLWAMMDGIETVENMGRCMTNNYSIQGFWKGWHCSYNRWLVRYMYIPLGGARLAFFNIWVIFTFVALWHDTELKLLAWGWMISLFFLPELIAGKMSSKLKDKVYYRHLRALGGVFNIGILIAANLVGFALGIDGLKLLVSQLMSFEGFLLFLAAFMFYFSLTQVMLEVRAGEARAELARKATKEM
ncbi:glycerol transporter [Entomophthora muscae]|uniref:Glycerol transporter n=1 Tax=Entomophthora muscae TaxID=34485 RepID=A0ACC2RFM4_9FUNG|nr:glycerol transporter [Entomophthora muscae]